MSGKIKIAASMLIFGSVGIFVKSIPLSSITIAFLRAIIAVLFLGGFLIISKKSPSGERSYIRGRLLPLAISGALMGLNWVLLFQAYNYTSVGNATLIYYFAPVFVMIFSPFILGESLNKRKVLCILGSLLGLAMVSDLSALNSGQGISAIRGTLFALGAAVLYASVVLSNKFIKGVPDMERTLVQMAAASLVLLPFILANGLTNVSSTKSILAGIAPFQWLLLLTVGILHTGIAYLLYFSGLKDTKAQSAAIISYLDPVSAVFFAAIFLKESMMPIQLLGGVLILLFTYLSEKTEQ